MANESIYWYFIRDKYINIYLDKIDNDRLKITNILPKRLSTLNWCIINNNKSLDMHKLFEKLVNCKNLILKTAINLPDNLPPNLESLYLDVWHNIIQYPESLKTYINTSGNMIIPPNLPKNVTKISVKGLCINHSIYNISENVTELIISVETLGLDNILWHNTLKKLKLNIHDECNKSLGILPYGLEYFSFVCEKYDFPLIIPPTVTFLKFISYDKYENIAYLNTLPDNIIYLTLNKNFKQHIYKFPLNCEKCKYLNVYDDDSEH